MKKYPLLAATDEQKEVARIFSETSSKTTFDKYSQRNQNDKSKIILDSYNGKIAEYMVYNTFISTGRIITEPDIKIYDRWHKSFDADLTYTSKTNEIYKLHVKNCCPHLMSFKPSWTFQREDPMFKNNIDNDYLILCTVGKGYNYMYIIKKSEAKFGEMILERLHSTKICIYEEDLLK
jgi:hypothetical protein